MVNASPIKKMAVFSSFLLIIVFLLIFLFVLPLLNEIEKYSQNIADKNTELAFFESEFAQSKEFENNQKGLPADINKIDNSFAKSEAPIDLIKFWENTAKLCSLSIDILPASVQKAESFDWKEMGFNLQLKGSFPDTLEFIKKIENGPYLLQIQNYSSALSPEGVSADLRVTAFAK